LSSGFIKDFKNKVDEINFAHCRAAKKIKLMQKGKETLISYGKDIMERLKKLRRINYRNQLSVYFDFSIKPNISLF
tara:strand:- start:126 stop:353 length:228 start_codon:yes stop_codon:yes gene_type:complete